MCPLNWRNMPERHPEPSSQNNHQTLGKPRRRDYGCEPTFQIDGFEVLARIKSIRLAKEFVSRFKRLILPTLFYLHEQMCRIYLGEIWQCDLLDQSTFVVFQRLGMKRYLC